MFLAKKLQGQKIVLHGLCGFLNPRTYRPSGLYKSDMALGTGT